MASLARLDNPFSNHGVKSSPIQNTSLASWIDFASEGRSWYSWGDAPAGIIKSGFPIPFITLETSEWTGAISTATLGASAKVIPALKINAEVVAINLLDI